MSCSEDIFRLLSVASSRGLEKEIPVQTEKMLFAMDPNQTIPLMVDVLDVVNVSGLSFLKRFFSQQAYYAVPALMAERVVVRALPLPTESYNRYSRACKEISEESEKQSFVAFVYENSSRILPVMDTWIGDIQGSVGVAAQLMPFLEDSDPEVRRAATYSLGQIRYSPAISLLLNLFHDPELWVRDGAVLSLALFKDDAVSPLCERMKQEGPAFRILALDALGRINTPRAREQMEAYSNDTNEYVRRAAKKRVGESLIHK